MRPLLASIGIAACALLVAACGSEGVSVPASDSTAAAGAEIFANNCAGCHTLGAAGSQGSGNRALRAQGPNFDQRVESYDDVLFAIRNGGFSGPIMPQNIVVGEDAEFVAEFVAEYSGGDVEEPAQPSATSSTIETGEANATSPDESSAPPADKGQGGGGNSGQN